MYKKHFFIGLGAIAVIFLAGSVILSTQAASPATRDIDGDGIMDGYDVWLDQQQKAGLVTDPIAFAIRNFRLDTLGGSLNPNGTDGTEIDSTLFELNNDNIQINRWKTKYEKKGHARSICDPIMMNMSFDKFDSKGRPRLLFPGMTTYSGLPTLQYQELRLVPHCDTSEYYANFDNNFFDVQLRDYIVYKIFRSFGVPSVDVVAFGSISFVSPDSAYNNHPYQYMFLQRDNEQDDQIPFTAQYNLKPTLIEDGKWDIWQPIWREDVKNNRFESVTYKDLAKNEEKTIKLDPETSIRYFLLSDFLKVQDRGVLHNEDYGQKNDNDIWTTIPYGFDLGFYGCNVPSPQYGYIYSALNDVEASQQAAYRAAYYRIARSIFTDETNLYKMLLPVDQFPFQADKTKMKKYLRIAFYKYSKYYTSREFAESMEQEYQPVVVNLPFQSNAAAEAAEDALSSSCTLPNNVAPKMDIQFVGTSTLTFSSSSNSNENDREDTRYAFYSDHSFDITPLETDLYISKNNAFKVDIVKDGVVLPEYSNYYGYSFYDLPLNAINEPGPYYRLPKGQASRFNVSSSISRWNEKPSNGNYTASITGIWLGLKYGDVEMPPNQTSSVQVNLGTSTEHISPTVYLIQDKLTPSLHLEYDSKGDEVSLVADFIVRIEAGSEDQKVRTSAWFDVNATDGKHFVKMSTTYEKPENADFNTREGNFYIVRAGTAATFNVKAVSNPLMMFSGGYYASLGGVSVINGFNKGEYLEVSANKTNIITIIGEKSPYITSYQSSVRMDEKLTLEGVRFHPTQNVVTLFDKSWKAVKQFTVASVNNGTQIQFVPATVASGIEQGSYQISVTHPTTGASNMVYIDITAVSKIVPNRQTVESGENAVLNFTVPLNTTRLLFYLSCPSGLNVFSNLGINQCNKFQYWNSSVRTYNANFVNTTKEIKKAVPNFYVYTKDKPNFAQGISGEVIVNPAKATSTSVSPSDTVIPAVIRTSSPTVTPAYSRTPSINSTPQASASPSSTVTTTPSPSSTVSATPAVTPSATASASPSASVTPTATTSSSPSASPTGSSAPEARAKINTASAEKATGFFSTIKSWFLR